MTINIAQKLSKLILLSSLFYFLQGCQSSKVGVVYGPLAQTKETEIAILMPMTGEHAVLGKQYNQLIKMGLEDALSSYVHVTSYDGANEKQVDAAMDKIIARDTKIILGPLFSPLASSIAERAKKHGIIIITMSNNPVLASEKLFVFGHAPLKQVDRMVNYLLDHDYKNFIALLPAGTYSRTVSQVIQDMLIQKRATLVRTEFYANTPESISKSISMVADSVDNLNEMDDALTKPVIYLADDPRNLNLVFGNLHGDNLDKKAVIAGDNRIDIDYPEEVNIVFTGSLNAINTKVEERAKAMGINHLSFIHKLAYDLGRITGSYMGENFSAEHFLARLSSKEPYVGLSGNTYFIDSIAQREYDIIRREGREYSTLEVAR